MQSRNRDADADAENALVDTVGEGGGGTNGESGTGVYMPPCVKQTQLVGSCRMTQGAQPAQRAAMGGKQGQEGGHVLMADSCFVWQKPTKHCKADILQLETIFFFFF